MSEVITVVAGIPRSGTSLMMKMLHAGGMPVFADNLFSYETDLVKGLPEYSRWLRECEGKAVKILDPHIYTPSRIYAYRFIWMDRDPMQQAKSAKKFLEAMGMPFGRGQVVPWANKVKRDATESLRVIRERGEVLRVRFEDVVRNPAQQAKRVADFCGLSAVDEMAAVVVKRRPECLPYMLEFELSKGTGKGTE